MRRAFQTFTPGVLAIALLATLMGGVHAQEPAGAEAEARAAEISALNPMASLDKATLDGFRDAPLFTPSRTRPTPPPPEPEVVAEAPPPAPEPVEEPAEPPTLKLSGIVQGPDGAIAFVAKEGETAVEQLRLGDQIDGWLVSSIDPAALKLTLDEREQEYRLFVPANPSSASSGDDNTDTSSDDDASSSSDDDDEDKTPKKAQRPGAQREIEAARKAQQDAQRRQQLRQDPQQQE